MLSDMLNSAPTQPVGSSVKKKKRKVGRKGEREEKKRKERKGKKEEQGTVYSDT